MDVVICNFPPMVPWYIPAAPAILKGACNHVGLTSKFIDFNINHIKGDTNVDSWVDAVLKYNPRVVALSIFSYKARDVALELSRKLKEKSTGITVVVGGPGLKDDLNNKIQADVQDLIDNKVIDHHVEHDGEYPFVEYLSDQFNLDRPTEFKTLEVPYLTDYSEHDFDFRRQHPRWEGYPIHIPITGSKGCVRNCTFCEIPGRWKFVLRNPEDIARDIKNTIPLLQGLNYHFHFTDSLVNGSMPAFDKLLDQFLEIKKEYPEFRWGGQFIIRRANQSGDDYWKKIADSGGQFLTIGVETGSDRLRGEMQKHFSNEDLYHSVRMMEKYRITCVFLMFTGMPTETKDDFNQTLELLTTLKPYQGHVITEIELGYLTTIYPGTPLYDSSKQDKDMILSKDSAIWFNKKNPTLDFQERINRRIKFEEHARHCGYRVAWDSHIQVEEAKTALREKATLIKIVEQKA